MLNGLDEEPERAAAIVARANARRVVKVRMTLAISPSAAI
jgi:hypothetical protein